jgi:4-hydroxy-2-oxoheptanedioate aldolase
MHRSVVLEKLRNDEAVWCAKTNLTDPNVVEIFGSLGLHCVWLCMEHGPIHMESVHNQVRTAKMNGMDSMVRVAKGSYADLIRPLEMDATGLMIPHCMSGEEAAQIVQATRFQPLGRRAIDSGNSDGPFCMRDVKEYIDFANRERFVVVQIEDKEAVECMEDIVAVEGIDVIFLGPADLSHSYGIPGEFNHPLIQAAVDKLAKLCKKHNRHWGMPASPESAPTLLEKGARFLAGGSDVRAISTYIQDLRDRFAELGLTFDGEF